MSKPIHLQRIKQRLKDCYLEALEHGYTDFADKLDEAGHELKKLGRKDELNELFNMLGECHRKARVNNLYNVVNAINIAQNAIIDEGLEFGEEYY